MLDQSPITAGIHEMPADIYHADPAPQPSLSSTLAKLMLAQSPLHAWTASARLNPAFEPVDKKTFDIGRAAHRAILGKGADFVTIPESMLATNGAASTKEAKEFIAQARGAGITPIKAAEAEGVEAMRVKAHEKLAGMGISFDPARSELAAFAEIGGIWNRAMLDNVPLDARQPIYDFKTCESAAPEACERAIMNYGYDLQAEHYRQVWHAATGEERAFRFVFQEKSAPHEICVVELGADSLMMARKKIARAREMWALCLQTGQWPGYPAGIHRIELPAWFHERWLERESVEADHKRQHGADILLAAMRPEARP